MANIEDEEFEQANLRGKALLKGPTAIAARYDRRIGRIVISLSTGYDVAFPPRAAQGLEAATPAQLDTIEISPAGLGIHFPKLDADLYLPALLEGSLGSKNWMASRMGSIGGSIKSEAKAAACRRNGARGGRPAKKATEAA